MNLSIAANAPAVGGASVSLFRVAFANTITRIVCLLVFEPGPIWRLIGYDERACWNLTSFFESRHSWDLVGAIGEQDPAEPGVMAANTSHNTPQRGSIFANDHE
jgi:hypothetical protein